MIKKFYILFKIARKLALSDAIKIISKIQQSYLWINFLTIKFNKIIIANPKPVLPITSPYLT